jgi:hypothetical protein
VFAKVLQTVLPASNFPALVGSSSERCGAASIRADAIEMDHATVWTLRSIV